LQFEFTFGSNELDVRNWVVDFGGLKSLKAILETTFDHKLIVAADDPYRDALEALGNVGVCDVVVLPAGGCEKFAEYVYTVAEQWLLDAGYGDRVNLLEVVVREHGANWASYTGEEA
jgi:6-pyruvoyltetrahydropterin/6-carboxytetrahydropterin synthase